jgi:cytochrome P450
VGRFEGERGTPQNRADIAELVQFFDEVIAERTRQPGEDLISWIISGSEAGDAPLSSRDLISFCSLLLIAGNETTTNLLGNAYHAFFAHPDQYELVRRASDLGPVVEEVLRYDSSVQGIARLVEHDVTIGDTAVPRDALLLILFASANRDEARWPDGEELHVDREPLDNLAFGSGIHLCLGAHLARLEVATALDVLRRRLASIAPAGPAVRSPSVIIRGFSSMPVEVEAA